MSFYIPNYYSELILWQNVSFAMNVKNQQLLWDLYAGIARAAKKKPAAIMETICGYYKEC